MRKLKIHLTKNSKGAIFSEAIRWYQGTDFSHCAIEFRLNKLGEDVIYHSSISSGVNFYSKELFLQKNTVTNTYELEINDDCYNAIMKQLIKNCGKEYAILQNIGIVIVDIMHRMGIKVSNPWKRGYNCSELVYIEVLSVIYPEESKTYDPETIRPDHVKEILDKVK